MQNSEIEAIVGGYHADPFGILGPHPASGPESGRGWEVRAFLPQAAAAEVVTGGGSFPMRRQHEAGFFVAAMDGELRPYRLRLRLWNGDAIEMEDPYRFPPLLTGFELHLHAEGTHYESYNTLGAHLAECDGVAGTRFAVWAPNAEVVSVVGDFNEWDSRRHPMRLREGGVWEIFLPGVGAGARYKYHVRSRYHGYRQMKADPYAFASETPPHSASVVANLDTYEWNDTQWMENRARQDWLRAPMAIYEVHLESWLRGPHGELLSYRELADKLIAYVTRLGYTHIELLPIMEHPFSGSWGYHRDEASWKSVDMLVRLLVDTVSKGGNLLLNVGPTARGEFDQRARDRLAGIGAWMKYHNRSIYGCTQAPAEFATPPDCRLTYNPAARRLYVHVFAWPFRHLHLDGYAGKVEYAQLLNDASEIPFAEDVGGTLTLTLPVIKPDTPVPVIELFLR
ncbi:MAG: alpha-L-fucosidase [Bryobacteraceae bacterium]|nr:alpha-L-fucosidase [Bryobacteraceae bacterium]